MKHLTILYLLALFVAATADFTRLEACDRCGCGTGRKVCRLVPDVKKITTFCYSYKCEDFCLNGRSRCIGTKEVCDCRGSRCESIMQPTCCEVLTRRVLTKVPVVEEKHGWKCVVETLCGGCGNCCASREATETEAQLAISSAEKQGADPAAATSDVFVPLDDQVTPASAALPVNTDALQVRKPSRFIDRLFRK